MTSAELTQRAPSDIEGKTASDRASFEFEMAYQMRVASDKIRFAINALDTIFPGKVTDISAHLLEALDRLGRNLTPEETALEGLLARLIADYDDKVELPDLPAHEVIAFLLRQRDLKQADLLPMFGLRSVASSVLNGKRELSKAHIRKLAEFFHSSPAAFF